MQAALKLTSDTFGRLDVVVNCAGVGVAFKTYNFNKERPHDLKDFARVIQVSAAVNRSPIVCRLLLTSRSHLCLGL